jgi:pilus assembly protein CpaB
LKQSGRRAILYIFAGVIVIGLGILIVTYFFRQALTPVAAPPPPTPVTEQVLVTARGVPAGQVLAPDDLTLMAVPIELAPLSRLTDPVQAIGKVSTVAMVAGEMVLPHHLIDTTNLVDRTLAFSLEDDQVLMAFPIVDLMSQLNILKKGDLVDILVSITETVESAEPLPEGEEAQERTYTIDAMQRIVITAIVVDYVSGEQPAQQPAAPATPGAEATPIPPPEPSRTETRPVAIMLALNPQDALVLKHLKDTGAVFDLVLRSPNSTQLFDLDPVTSEYLIDRYGLQPPR